MVLVVYANVRLLEILTPWSWQTPPQSLTMSPWAGVVDNRAAVCCRSMRSHGPSIAHRATCASRQERRLQMRSDRRPLRSLWRQLCLTDDVAPSARYRVPGRTLKCRPIEVVTSSHARASCCCCWRLRSLNAISADCVVVSRAFLIDETRRRDSLRYSHEHRLVRLTGLSI